MEETIAKADGAFEAVQGLSCHTVLHWCVVIGIVCREGLLADRGPPLTSLLQLADVTVALIVHFPCLTKNPAAFDVRC